VKLGQENSQVTLKPFLNQSNLQGEFELSLNEWLINYLHNMMCIVTTDANITEEKLYEVLKVKAKEVKKILIRDGGLNDK
jgi:hypothetical protein